MTRRFQRTTLLICVPSHTACCGHSDFVYEDRGGGDLAPTSHLLQLFSDAYYGRIYGRIGDQPGLQDVSDDEEDGSDEEEDGSDEGRHRPP